MSYSIGGRYLVTNRVEALLALDCSIRIDRAFRAESLRYTLNAALCEAMRSETEPEQFRCTWNCPYTSHVNRARVFSVLLQEHGAILVDFAPEDKDPWHEICPPICNCGRRGGVRKTPLT
jgi:hypothetical protein